MALRPDDLDPAAFAHGQPTTDRDGRHGSPGELGNRGDRLRIAGDGRLRRDACGDRCDVAELLAGEPPDLVELVHTHVEEDPAAAGAERGGRWTLVPLPRPDLSRLAEHTGPDALPQLDERGHEATPVAD